MCNVILLQVIHGGGVAVLGSSRVSISDSTVHSNSASFVIMLNVCWLMANRYQVGGGVYVSLSKQLTFRNCSVVANMLSVTLSHNHTPTDLGH